MKSNCPKVIFFALDTFSVIGGIQQFNQRVLKNLIELESEGVCREPRMHIMRDLAESIPRSFRRYVTPFGAGRAAFLLSVIRCARANDVMFIGHINIASLALIAKAINPAIKIVLFVHGDEVWNDPVYRRRQFYDAPALKAVDCIAAVSRFTASVMGREFGFSANKFTVFPNAVDVAPVAGCGDNNVEVVLCVTRLAVHDQGKHVDALIAAFAQVVRSRPLARLEIVGDGVLRPELMALAVSLDLDDRVIFHGRIGDDALADAYSRATCFVLPSSKEGFGIVYLEAWLRGLPVICSTDGAPCEFVEDGIDGLVIDHRDIGKLASGIERLLADRSNSRAMGARGRHKVLSRYLDTHFHSNLKTLIERVYAK